MNDKLFENIKLRPVVGNNVMSAGTESDLYVNGYSTSEVDKLLASIAGNGEGVLESRQAFASAVVEPIMQMIPYVTMYDRFFMPVTYDYGQDNALPVEDNLVMIAWSSHPQTSIFYTAPGYKFTRPTFQMFTSGVKIPWNLMKVAGWNVLARQMNLVAWELAKKADTVALAVLTAAVPASHLLTVSGGITKASIDQVIRSSSQIGFPVSQAVINPSRLMEMQGWTWTMPSIPDNVSQQLVDNLYYGNYGGINWFVNPNAPTDSVLFGGDPSVIGYHQMRGAARNDSAIDITNGVDLYTFRSQEHSWTASNGLSLWKLTIA